MRTKKTCRRSSARGAVLLEVIFSVALFAAAAGTVIGAFNASFRAMRQLRIQAHAVDRAVTMLSEIQMGLVPPVDDGPTAYDEPDDDWTWQIVTADIDPGEAGQPMTQVEIRITYAPEGYTYSLFHLMPADAGAVETEVAERNLPPAGGVGL